jgi:acyl-[acyl-carrier-protein]-phospholipid O-acyltransferase / long-chain-fatty-acid--[acyl-carrier-protein] ligase
MSTAWTAFPDEKAPPPTAPPMKNTPDSNPAGKSRSEDAALRTPVTLRADGGERLLSPSFLGLLFTQFLGALNDSLFRWLVAWIGGDLAAHDAAFRWFVSQFNPHLTQDGYKAIAFNAGLLLLILPYLLFAAPAGYLADRLSKRTVIVGCKVAEVILMLAGTATILYGNVWLMFLMVFLMGCHSAVFSPSKYGSIPEIVRDDRLPQANGLVGMTTILSIVLGTVGGGYLYQLTQPAGTRHWGIWAAAILGVAGTGLATSLLIRRLPVANPTRRWEPNIFAETGRDFRILYSFRTLFWAAAGSTLFWSLGGLFQSNITNFGNAQLHLDSGAIGLLTGILAVGVGSGCLFAGFISCGKILFVLVPLGAAGLALMQIALFCIPTPDLNIPASTFAYVLTAASLLVLGFCGGMYDVPLQAYLQHRSPDKNRGSIFAATNFLTFGGTLALSALYMAVIVFQWASPDTVFLLCGLLLIPLVVLMVYHLPYDCTRFTAIVLMKLFYRVRVEGKENIPEGPALLTPNHVSYADGLLVGLNSPRDPRMLVDDAYFQTPFLRWFGRLARVIPITPGKKSIVESLRQARAALQAGQLICVFPEGGITRDGQMKSFQPGVIRILKGTDAPVVPVYIDGMWGSVFSFEGGKALWKFPKKFRPRVTIRFGTPIHNPADEKQIEQAVRELALRS